MTDPQLALLMLGAVHRRHHARLPDRLHADGAGRVLRLLRDGRRHLQPAGPATPTTSWPTTCWSRCRCSCSWATWSSAPTSSTGCSAASSSPRGTCPASLAVATLITCALFATATGHRRRGRDADGPAGLPGHAARRLRHQAVGRRDLRRRHARHPDPALDHADPLWRRPPASRWSSSTPPRCSRASCWPACTSLYVIGRAIMNPSLAPKLPRGGDRRPVRPVVYALADLVLPARGADLCGARRHHVRPGDAVGGGGDRRARRAPAGRRLSRADLGAAAGGGVPDRRAPPPWSAGCSSARWIFASVFAYLGGQQLIKEFVVSLDLSPITFLILAQMIIFLLGWPLEWTEIIVIFVPIFLPLLEHLRHRSAVLRHPGRAQPADLVPVARRWRWRPSI